MKEKALKDQHFMRQAMRLALKAYGKTSPNPLVGAVVVKAGRVVGSGYHHKAGSPHAEVLALEEAGARAKGADLYVTLEPCCHFGRTPPCVHKIISSGIKRVYVGMVDPNPLNNGKGMQILRDNRIGVHLLPLGEDLPGINQPFLKYITRKLPYLTVKTGQSLDGKIATKDGDSKWITSDRSRALAHRMRKDFDAIMVGINTVLRDNPRLDAWFSRRQPVKVVVDTNLSTPADANIFASGSKVVIVTLPKGKGQETENKAALEKKAQILEVKEKAGQADLRDAMKKLGAMGITTVLVEGGGTLNGSLFDEGLVDRILFFISPKIVGGKDSLTSVMGKGVPRIEKAVALERVTCRRLGSDFLVEGYVHRYR